MDTEKEDLNPTPAETDSAQTNESVENSKSEDRVGPFVHEKSADRVKEIYSSGRILPARVPRFLLRRRMSSVPRAELTRFQPRTAPVEVSARHSSA
jgi:hypothetical protein